MSPIPPHAAAEWLAGTLGLRAFPLADADKPLYHAGAAMASNFLVTLYWAARLLEESNAPPEALVPSCSAPSRTASP